MTYWIFTINDTDNEFEKRVNEKKWPIFNRTPNRRSLMKDDLVVFYKAGVKNAQEFIGKAELDSEAGKAGIINYAVKLKNIEVWKNGVDIKHMLHELIFIGNTSLWGIYMQGGVRRITEKDYNTIVSKF